MFICVVIILTTHRRFAPRATLEFQEQVTRDVVVIYIIGGIYTPPIHTLCQDIKISLYHILCNPILTAPQDHDVRLYIYIF